MGVRIREHLPRIEAALARLYDYADALIADRQRSPRDDFVTCLVRAQADEPGQAGQAGQRGKAEAGQRGTGQAGQRGTGQRGTGQAGQRGTGQRGTGQAGQRGTGEAGLTAAELRDSLVLLIFGGFDTTRNQLGLAMQAFLDHPGQWRLLAERPRLGPAAVEEVMRIRPTTTWVTREATADFTFDGLAIGAGTTIHLFCESAGTDPTDADDAGSGATVAEFDITAGERRPHFGFGGGIHYCLGHYVARTDMCEALAVLARRLREPRPAGQAAWLPDSGNTGPVRLPIAFEPGR
jgi:cytochrome P450